MADRVLGGSAEPVWIVNPSTGVAAWGGITGTLSDQTDLQTELDLKVDTIALSSSPTASEPLKADGSGGVDFGGVVDATKFTVSGVNGIQIPSVGETLVGNAGGGVGYVGSNVTATGFYAARENTGSYVTATGFYAARENTGGNVTATGYYAARENTGGNVTATGFYAAYQNTGSYVTATGFYAARENTGGNVTATGRNAAYQNTGINVTATGFYAARENTGGNVTATGFYAAYQNTGSYVTATGFYAARENTFSDTIHIGSFAKALKSNQTIMGADNLNGASQINALSIVSGTTGGTVEGLGRSSTTGETLMASIAWSWNVSTHASRQADITLYAEDFATEREILRGRANGSASAIGFLGATPVIRQTVSAAATDTATTQTLANDLRTALINLGLVV